MHCQHSADISEISTLHAMSQYPSWNVHTVSQWDSWTRRKPRDEYCNPAELTAKRYSGETCWCCWKHPSLVCDCLHLEATALLHVRDTHGWIARPVHASCHLDWPRSLYYQPSNTHTHTHTVFPRNRPTHQIHSTIKCRKYKPHIGLLCVSTPCKRQNLSAKDGRTTLKVTWPE